MKGAFFSVYLVSLFRVLDRIVAVDSDAVVDLVDCGHQTEDADKDQYEKQTSHIPALAALPRRLSFFIGSRGCGSIRRGFSRFTFCLRLRKNSVHILIGKPGAIQYIADDIITENTQHMPDMLRRQHCFFISCSLSRSHGCSVRNNNIRHIFRGNICILAEQTGAFHHFHEGFLVQAVEQIGEFILVKALCFRGLSLCINFLFR